jgi:glycolate oxidase iron-sulfur subunit
VPGLELREIADPEICCGSAGVYNLLQPQAAAQLGQRKAEHVLATGADLLVTSNPGCMLQLRASLADRGAALPMAHVAEVLDAAIRGLGPGALGVGRRTGASPA